MLNKKLILSSAIISTLVGFTTLVVRLIMRIQYLREDVNYQLVELVHERLANAEKQLFQTHTRRTTRENIHKAIVHTDGWEYFCDTEGMLTKLSVSKDMLNLFMQSDEDGKLAYMECRDILDECIDLIDSSTPKTYFIDDLADEIKRIIRGRDKRTFDSHLKEYSERLDPNWYELDDETVETVLRPIYPWFGDWLPSSAVEHQVDKLLIDDSTEDSSIIEEIQES